MAASSAHPPSSRTEETSTARRSPHTRGRHRVEGCSSSRVFERLQMTRLALSFPGLTHFGCSLESTARNGCATKSQEDITQPDFPIPTLALDQDQSCGLA